jgi:two-component system sensor histidine kinase PilS (NtrC family)
VRRPVALDSLLAETVDMLRADPLARDVRVEVAAAEKLTAAVDPDQLRQVLINLVRNGFQAAGPRGEVRVALARAEQEAQIRVWDSAGSITEEMMGHLFEPFFTTRDGGTGLGLSTAHSIIRAHGGTIRVRSSRAEGTEFVVGLPL